MASSILDLSHISYNEVTWDRERRTIHKMTYERMQVKLLLHVNSEPFALVFDYLVKVALD